MAHFEARFPQHNKPVQDPKPEDYLDAAIWHRWIAKEHPVMDIKYFSILRKAEAFERVYRRLKWAQKLEPCSNEECA